LTNSLGAVRIGSRQPRVRSVPAYVTTSGWEAVELGRAAGLVCDEWQEDCLVDSLGERPNGLWSAPEAAFIASRQNGKNAIFEVRELAGLMLFGERFIVHTAHEVKTAMEAFRRSKDLFTDHDDLRKQVKKVVEANGEEGIELYGTGANRLTRTRRLRFIARSKHSGRGFTCDCLVWDEAYALLDLHVDAQMPALSAVANPQILYGSSPPLNSDEGAVMMRVRRRALAGDPTLAFLDWGIAGSLDKLGDIDLDDRDNWYAANPALGIRISEETVERERRAMSDEGFARERLGVWPPDRGAGFRVIPEADWVAAADPIREPPVKPVAFGLEVSWDRSKAAIGVSWRRADGLRQVELTQGRAVDYRHGTGWVVARAKELAERWNPCAFVVPTGPAASLIDDLEAAGVEVTTMNSTQQGEGYGLFFDGVSGEDRTARNVRHGNQQELNTAVAGAAKRHLGDATVFERKASVGYPPVGAVKAALWGHVAKAGEWSDDYDVLDSVY
jgi:hypothetical protein